VKLNEVQCGSGIYNTSDVGMCSKRNELPVAWAHWARGNLVSISSSNIKMDLDQLAELRLTNKNNLIIGLHLCSIALQSFCSAVWKDQMEAQGITQSLLCRTVDRDMKELLTLPYWRQHLSV